MKIDEVIIRGDIDLDRLSMLPLGSDKVSIVGEQSTPVQLGGGFDVINKAKGGERIIAGYASVIEVDKEDHIIPKSALEYGIQTLLNDSEYANLMLVHQNVQIGKIIAEYKNLKTHVDDKGLFICGKIRNDLEIANEVWGYILEGKLNGFSIAGEIVEATIECDDTKCVKKIEKLNIFEVSVCDYPVNSKSGFVVVSKSSDTADVGEIDVINKKVEQMTKKKVKVEPECVECSEEETPTETTEVVETKSDDEVIEASEPTMDISQTVEEMARQLAALTTIVQQMNAKSEEVIEEAEPTEEEEEEEEEEEMEKAEEKVEETPTEEKSEPETSVNISKEDFDELKKSVEKLVESIKKSEEVSELEVAIKSKDDVIASLTTKIETLEKAEVEPKTTNTIEEEEESDIDISDVSFVKGTLEKGVFYHSPDY